MAVDMESLNHAMVVKGRSVPAELYEALIAKEEGTLEVFLSLAVLYFEATDCGIAVGHHLSGAFMDRAWKGCREVLAEARKRFPESTEVRFWQLYIGYIHLGDRLVSTRVGLSFAKIGRASFRHLPSS